MTRYVIWAEDCDGPGDVRYAPICDTIEEAQAWIDDWTKDMEGGEITRVWIEEEEEEEHCDECNFTWNPGYMHHMCPPSYESDEDEVKE
jgi:hypothetical protein